MRLYSSDYPKAEEIGHVIRGRLSHDIMIERQVMFEQDTDNRNFGHGKWLRTNTYSAKCTNVSVVGNVISIEYTRYRYLAGGARWYTDLRTFSFIIHPTVYLDSLEGIFNDPTAAFPSVQAAVRSYLMKVDLRRDEEVEPVRIDQDLVNRGTLDWKQFSSFIFSDEGLVIFFAPYAVGPYAYGHQRAIVNWRTIGPFVRYHILCALGRASERFTEFERKERERLLGLPSTSAELTGQQLFSALG